MVNKAGRPKGSYNQSSKAIKEMIIAALGEAGGAEYLVRQANENPSAFMALIGKVIPKEVELEVKRSIFEDPAAIEYNPEQPIVIDAYAESSDYSAVED